ncbi:uncharacterized protein K444DRAFT_543262 [Hyaloscypha bicolor E]|uniref:non-specific serine/threonine protein kinase n=1 Tax=Hyaloscypha bicolor E TaxID=1095630 RepID=A0A2J6SP45_9HELO|nr:uncharacterized protein K444DRAFT_543262 [Hyaloscypha bicolor E]PMD52536.1 hypothetical protein K444DRAFT_543262 [Hyaloscypha bicolor E]
MPPLRKYGTKRSTASAAIFGRSPIAAPASVPAPPTLRDPLGELSTNLGALVLVDTAKVSSKPEPELLPLLNLLHLSPKSWGTVLSTSDTTLEKIAKASYAEVYRATNSGGTSILKVMEIKVSTNPESLESRTACAVEDVVSELRIMNQLTELPGFVLYKDAHLIRGKPVPQIKQAWDAWEEKYEESMFPDPDVFGPTSTFLVIELGDAGRELNDEPMKQIEQVWDVLLGVVIALSRAEATHEFEHRDLHNSNICVIQKGNFASINPNNHGNLKFGFSGLEITIIDYGLSRAKLSSGEIVFNNLETDPGLFKSTATGGDKIQFDNYRRMRTHLLTGERKMAAFYTLEPDQSKNGNVWSEYIPYTNVLWIRYLLHHLERSFKEHGVDQKELTEFKNQTKELKTRLDPRTLVKNGAFETAGGVLDFVWEKGWVSQEQLEERGVDTTILSEA